jgi:cytochrome P450
MEALRLAVRLGWPAVGAGVIARRRPMMGLLEKVQADRSVVQTVRALRDKYGRGPLELVLPGRRLVIILDELDVARVLEQSPAPFTPANKEKQAALSPFQPHGVLISQGPIRQARREVNEQALETDMPLHHLAASFVDVVNDEIGTATADAQARGSMNAADFTTTWWKLVRRVTLGSAARDDDALTDALWTLRSNGNWSYFHPTRRKVRDEFFNRLYPYAEQADHTSLVGALDAVSTTGGAVDPVGQIPHWLFAFDAAGIACARALALLASHPHHLRRALDEIAATDVLVPQQYSFLRACVLESVRLWPTTPAILRDSTEPTAWGPSDHPSTIDEGAAFLILATAFHRDSQALDYADRFEPDVWLDGRAQATPQLVPFSAGPAVCPGRNLVLHITSTTLAVMLSRAQYTLTSTPALSPGEPLPFTLNNFGLEWAVT